MIDYFIENLTGIKNSQVKNALYVVAYDILILQLFNSLVKKQNISRSKAK